MHRKTKSVQKMQTKSNLGRTKKSILEVAHELFDRFGYDKTSMNDIAKRSHKAKGSIYYNFNGKMDIFKSLVEQEFASVKTNLTKTCQIGGETSVSNGKIIDYLKYRMELFDKASMVKQTIMTQYYDASHEMLTAAEEIRKDFDQWEWQLFHHICDMGKQLGVLTSDIEPNVFANMLQMLLKALEIQFFAKNEYEKSKSTYESMVGFLLNDLK